jgi:peroxiredoxin Q/BCP
MTSPQRFYETIELGAAASPFSLPAFPAGSVSLADYSGATHVWLFFHSRDFVGKPALEDVSWSAAVSLSAMSADVEQFAQAQSVVLGISRDDVDTHARLAALLNLKIPLLSDRSGAVGERYGLLPENRWAGSSDGYDFPGCAVLIDKTGRVRHWQETDFVTSPHRPMPDFVQAKFESNLRLRFVQPRCLPTTDLLDLCASLNG